MRNTQANVLQFILLIDLNKEKTIFIVILLFLQKNFSRVGSNDGSIHKLSSESDGEGLIVFLLGILMVFHGEGNPKS